MAYRQRLAAELRPILASGEAARALATGSHALTSRIRAWVMQDGHRGRLGGLATGAALAGKTIEMWPATGAALTCAWVIAAWMHAPPPPPTRPAPSPPQQTPADEPQQEPPPRPLIEDRAAFLHWLADLIGDANGIHLDPLHRALTQQPGCTLPRPHLGPLLDRLDVPYQRTMSVGGIAGRSGVRRADVEAALTALPQGTPQATSETSHSAPDLRKSQPLSTALTPTLSPSQEP